jgi:hypothetical protein
MVVELHYLIRSKLDGQYLVARPRQDPDAAPSPGFLLLFSDHADALSYLNTHAAEFADRFAVETVSSAQLGQVMSRWSFVGVGLVKDPLLPRVEFLARGSLFE